MVAVWLAGGACVRYVPAPIEPTEHLSLYRARRLDDSGVVAWVSRYGPPPEPNRWTARQLALVALGTRAELDRSRADWRTAQLRMGRAQPVCDPAQREISPLQWQRLQTRGARQHD